MKKNWLLKLMLFFFFSFLAMAAIVSILPKPYTRLPLSSPSLWNSLFTFLPNCEHQPLQRLFKRRSPLLSASWLALVQLPTVSLECTFNDFHHPAHSGSSCQTSVFSLSSDQPVFLFLSQVEEMPGIVSLLFSFYISAQENLHLYADNFKILHLSLSSKSSHIGQFHLASSHHITFSWTKTCLCQTGPSCYPLVILNTL